MDKYDLLLKANVKDDVERLRKLAEFDQSVGGMKLYRYRPLNPQFPVKSTATDRL